MQHQQKKQKKQHLQYVLMLTSFKKNSISATAPLMTLSLIMYQATLTVITTQLIILRRCIGEQQD